MGRSVIRVIGPGSQKQKLQTLLAEHDNGEFDLLVVNALSEHPDTEFEQIDDHDFDQICINDVAECFSEVAAVLPSLREGSRIVFLVSSAFLGSPRSAPQATAASMLIGLARSLALELASQWISVSSLAFDRCPTVEDAEAAIKGLRAHRAADINGQLILLDGGANLSLKNAWGPSVA